MCKQYNHLDQKRKQVFVYKLLFYIYIFFLYILFWFLSKMQCRPMILKNKWRETILEKTKFIEEFLIIFGCMNGSKRTEKRVHSFIFVKIFKKCRQL